MAEVASISLDTSAMQAYARFLKQAPAIAHEEMAASLQEALLLLEREIKDGTPVGVHGAGGLRGSITHKLRGEAVDAGRGVAGDVFSPLNYAESVELGTKPHFPPIAPLQDWVEHKLGVDPNESAAVAYLVARKIAKHGTKGAHMFEKGLSENSQQVVQILSAAVDRIATRLEGGAQ